MDKKPLMILVIVIVMVGVSSVSLAFYNESPFYNESQDDPDFIEPVVWDFTGPPTDEINVFVETMESYIIEENPMPVYVSQYLYVYKISRPSTYVDFNFALLGPFGGLLMDDIMNKRIRISDSTTVKFLDYQAVDETRFYSILVIRGDVKGTINSTWTGTTVIFTGDPIPEPERKIPSFAVRNTLTTTYKDFSPDPDLVDSPFIVYMEQLIDKKDIIYAWGEIYKANCFTFVNEISRRYATYDEVPDMKIRVVIDMSTRISDSVIVQLNDYDAPSSNVRTFSYDININGMEYALDITWDDQGNIQYNERASRQDELMDDVYNVYVEPFIIPSVAVSNVVSGIDVVANPEGAFMNYMSKMIYNDDYIETYILNTGNIGWVEFNEDALLPAFSADYVTDVIGKTMRLNSTFIVGLSGYSEIHMSYYGSDLIGRKYEWNVNYNGMEWGLNVYLYGLDVTATYDIIAPVTLM